MTARAWWTGSPPAGRIWTRPRETGSSPSHSPPFGNLARARSMWIGCPDFMRLRAGLIIALAAATILAVER